LLPKSVNPEREGALVSHIDPDVAGSGRKRPLKGRITRATKARFSERS
jgi:hypothetical protein